MTLQSAKADEHSAPAPARCRVCVVAWAATLLALQLAGCQRLPQFSAAQGRAAARSTPSDQLTAALVHDHWVREVNWSPLEEHALSARGPHGLTGGRDHFRWRYAGPEWLALADSTDRSDIVRSLERLIRGSDASGRNAAILLAQLDPEKEPAALARIVRETSPEVGERTQAAAAEAWCWSISQTGGAESAFREPGTLLGDNALPEVVRAELLRGTARHIAPSRVPAMDEAFSAGSPHHAEFRLAAIDGCLLHAARLMRRKADSPGDVSSGSWSAALWPKEIHSLRYDRVPEIRLRYGQWLAASQHPLAFEVLEAQLNDVEANVADGAIVSLGLLDHPRAKKRLDEFAKSKRDRVRQFTVRAFGWRSPAEVTRFADDPSPAVRREVARQLGRTPSTDAAETLARLLADADGQVQLAAVAAVEFWDDATALPVLLEALAVSYHPTREAALLAVRERTEIEEYFPVEADESTRRAALAQWRSDHRVPASLLSQRMARAATATPETPSDSTTPAAQSAGEVLRQQLALLTGEDGPEREAALTSLQEASEGNFAAIERLASEHPELRSPLLFGVVLPRPDNVYADLRNLGAADLATRRRGATALAERAKSRTLSPLVMHRIGEHLAHEQSALVWQVIAPAFMADATEEATHLAVLALQHTWPDVRLLGCDYLHRHARPDHARWILPLLSDPDESVRAAGIEAAGRCGHPLLIDGQPDGFPGLRALMTGADGTTRQQALFAMNRIGDPDAEAEMLRLAQSADNRRRIRVIAEMGAAGHRRFAAPLIRLAWTEPDGPVRRQLLESIAKIVPLAEHPEGLADAQSDAERARLWLNWSDTK